MQPSVLHSTVTVPTPTQSITTEYDISLNIKYLHATKDDGLHYWRTSPNNNLPLIPPPTIRSHHHDLLLDGQLTHSPTAELHGFVDTSNWAACPQTRRSFAGTCLRLAGC
jgi:hypothetical protein